MWSMYNFSKSNFFVLKFLCVSKNSWNNNSKCLYQNWKTKGLGSINYFTERIEFLGNLFLFSLHGRTVERFFFLGEKKEKKRNYFPQKYRLCQNRDSSMNYQLLPKLADLGIHTGSRGSSSARTANDLTSNKGRSQRNIQLFLPFPTSPSPCSVFCLCVPTAKQKRGCPCETSGILSHGTVIKTLKAVTGWVEQCPTGRWSCTSHVLSLQDCATKCRDHLKNESGAGTSRGAEMILYFITFLGEKRKGGGSETHKLFGSRSGKSGKSWG